MRGMVVGEGGRSTGVLLYHVDLIFFFFFYNFWSQHINVTQNILLFVYCSVNCYTGIFFGQFQLLGIILGSSKTLKLSDHVCLFTQ